MCDEIVDKQTDLFGAAPPLDKNLLYILISGLQKEIRRGHTDEAEQIVARIITNAKERGHVYRRLVNVLFEDVASTAPRMQEASQFVLQGSRADLMAFTALLAESPKSRASDDLVWTCLDLQKGLAVKDVSDLKDLTDVERLLCLCRGVSDVYAEDKQLYFGIFGDLLSNAEKAAIGKAVGIGAKQAILHPLGKLLPTEQMYYPEFEPPVLDFDGVKSYWVDQHTRVGKRLIAVLAKELNVARALLSETIFLGEGALIAPPRIGWNYGVKLFSDRYGFAFYDLIRDKAMWKRLNELRGEFLRKT